jgi:CRISPR-associated protein Cas2
MGQAEVLTMVLYDIPHDRSRTKVSERCADFGLVRFQYSAFQGPLTKNRREELAIALESLIEVYGGVITILPVCSSDLSQRVDLYVEPPVIEAPVLKVFQGESDDDSTS